jgi:type III pantothenate kinase
MSYKNIIADIGNSRVKFKVDNKVTAFEYYSDSLADYLKSLAVEGFDNFYYSSVNKEAEGLIVSRLFGTIQNIENIDKLLASASPIDFSNIRGMGSDRKLSLIAVHRTSDVPLVTVDCGTAVTVNLLDEDGICLGGVIMPGFKLQAKALNQFTSDLPLVEDPVSRDYIGRDTESAIRCGVLNAIVGGIITTICGSSFSTAPDVFVTGGYGDLIQQRLKSHYMNVLYVEDLVLKGIEYLLSKSTKAKTSKQQAEA